MADAALSPRFIAGAKDPGKVGARKTNELQPPEWLLPCRELWAERANHFLRLAGCEAHIDHKTLEAMNHIRVAPDREQAFAAITGEMDMDLGQNHGLGR